MAGRADPADYDAVFEKHGWSVVGADDGEFYAVSEKRPGCRIESDNAGGWELVSSRAKQRGFELMAAGDTPQELDQCLTKLDS